MQAPVQHGVLMLVRQFKFKRNKDKGGFRWTAQSEVESPGFYRSFTAVGKTLADVKEFAALVRLCERTGSLERLSEMHPPGFENRMQTTWGLRWKGTSYRYFCGYTRLKLRDDL
jgi:hypothetical protein